MAASKKVDKPKKKPAKPKRKSDYKPPPGGNVKQRGKQDAYIAAYIRHLGVKKRAYEELGISASTIYQWERDDDFMERLDTARNEWYEHLMAAAFQRAVTKSDTLLIFLLKSAYPERYDDNIRRLNYERKQFDDSKGKFELPPLVQVELIPKGDNGTGKDSDSDSSGVVGS